MTEVQRKVLMFMRQHGDRCKIVTGRKATTMGKLPDGNPIVVCSKNTEQGLRTNDLVIYLGGGMYCLSPLANHKLSHMQKWITRRWGAK